MAKVVDLRGAGGQMVFLGDSLTLPSSNSLFSANPEVAGSIRFNPVANRVEYIGVASETWLGIDSGIDSVTAAQNAMNAANEAAGFALVANDAWDGAVVAEASAVAAAAAADVLLTEAASALAAGTVSDLVGTRIYTGRAALDADLVPADGLYALVIGDATAANNDLYRKIGATTVGSWSVPLGLFAAASAEAVAAQGYALAAADEIETKLSLIGGVNGTAFIDTVGNGYGFIPASEGDGDLEFPFLNANDAEGRLGPLRVQVIEGVDGIVFTDSVGNSLPISGEADAGLTAAQVQKIARLPNSVVTFGHSKTSENSWGGPVNPSNPNGGTARRSDIGYLAWLDYYLKGSINWIHNAGVGGETDAQMLSRVQADVVAKGAACCIIQGGTCNSINAGLTADQIIALQLGTETADSSNSILGLMQDAGIQTVWLTDPTWATGHPDLTASKFATLCRVNRAMLQAQGYKPGLLAVDTAGLVVDPLSATGASRAYYTQSDDFIHGTPIRGRAQGKLSADRMIAAGFPLMDILPTSLADTYAASSTSKQLLDNPFMTGTGGSGPAGGVVTGTIPTGCRIAVSTPSTAWAAGSITSTTVDRADGFGKDWVVTVNSSPVAGAQVFLILENASGSEIRTRLSADDVAQASAQIDITGMSKVNGHEFYSSLSTGAGYPVISTLERDADANWSSLFYSQADLTGGVMRTGRASIPSGTLGAASGDIRFRMTFDGSAGTATIRMGRAQFLKNS